MAVAYDVEHLIAAVRCFSRYFAVGDNGSATEVSPNPVHSALSGRMQVRDVAAVLSSLPTRTMDTLAVHAPARLTGQAWVALVQEVHRWVRSAIDVPGGVLATKDFDVVEQIAAFGDLLQAVAEAEDRGKMRRPYEYLGVLDAVRATEHAVVGSAAQLFVHRRHLFTELDDAALRVARAHVLLALMFTARGWALNANESDQDGAEALDLFADHIDEPHGIASAVFERRSLDPALLRTILEPDVPALTTGVL